MRMWMIEPASLCRKHLLGEHNELHMLAGSLLKNKNLGGFLEKKLLEPASLRARHEALAEEMRARGYRHASPLPAFEEALAARDETVRAARVDREAARRDLAARCPDCAARLACGQGEVCVGPGGASC